MRRRKRITRKQSEATKPSFISHEQQSNCYEGERLVRLLKSMEREIELAKRTKGSLPDKIWINQRYAIGVNDVTRVLERITPSTNSGSSDQEPPVTCNHGKASSVQLQAVLLACDCNPKWLTKHLPSLASSRNVPLIYVRDNKCGSLRLGALVKLKTAMAIGVKAKESGINKLIKDILHNGDVVGGNGCSEGDLDAKCKLSVP